MARPKKKKVETVVPTGEEGAEVEIDAAVVGEGDGSSLSTAQAASPERARTAAAEAKWQAACATFQKADFEAQRMRLVATEQLKHEKKARAPACI